ncbi:Hypothetical protein R9X50_00261500 [Acrodontium crateriforme]|uniref:N-acetyltransferase domain-containing protein n=1 Tax=Acrodontium crateriforme TaxID=150365 RepID=A0AAQ3M2H2_9PEZI|nr:Hypothetical protein R9X50_00261500 [Acrodontium crateriforme]
MTIFTIRPAKTEYNDAERLVAFFNSQVDFLPTIGSTDQWTEYVDATRAKRVHEWVTNSELHECREFNGQYTRAFIAEVKISAENDSAEMVKLARPDEATQSLWLPVAGLVLEGKSPEYVRSILPEQDDHRPFIYLSYLISDQRTNKLAKGAGSALIAHAREQVKKAGLDRLCVDCYAGNNKKLTKYYESQGFALIGDFKVEEKNFWPGSVLEMLS